MKKHWMDIEAYVKDELEKGADSVVYYEVIGDVPTSKSKASYSVEIENYTELGEALSRFDEVVSYGGRSTVLYKMTSDGTMDEPKVETLKVWMSKERKQ